MKIRKLFGNKKHILNYDQALLIKVAYVSESAYQELKQLESSISNVLPVNSHLDGDDISEKDATIYLYGPSADLIFAQVESLLLKASTGFDSIVVNFQYGRPDDPGTIDVNKKIK